MKKRMNTYLAIALTTYCNYRCFYCKQGGESISKKMQTISFSNIKRIVKNAYEVGITNFRITGGEPTSVSYFGEIIGYIMSFEHTRVRITTNGFKISKYVDILRKYKNRLDVVFSVDSISEYLNGVHFQKYLSEDVIKATRLLRENEIVVRYNIVVTKLNEGEMKLLVLKAVDELNVNVKLLDLNRFSEYLGYGNTVSGKEAFKLWENLFISMGNFYPFLKDISNALKSEWTTQFVGEGYGIPMSCYFRGENWIQVKDSTKGARYSEFCMQKCSLYKEGNCQEGVLSLFLSSNFMLHLSGCKNEQIHYDLNKQDDEQIKKTMRNLLSQMEKLN